MILVFFLETIVKWIKQGLAQLYPCSRGLNWSWNTIRSPLCLRQDIKTRVKLRLIPWQHWDFQTEVLKPVSNLYMVLQLNNSCLKGSQRDKTIHKAIIRTLLNTEITGHSFLLVSLIRLSLAGAWIIVSVPSCPVCDVVEGQSNLAPQMSSDNRMLLRMQSGKLQQTRKTDVIVAQIIGNA